MTTTRGVLQILSAPSPMCPHVEWAVGGAFGAPVSLDWKPQPAERASYRAEFTWSGPVGTATRLASALKRWPRIRFEVTEHATDASEGERYSYTPTLGVFHATMGLHGDAENELMQLFRPSKHDTIGSFVIGLLIATVLLVAVQIIAPGQTTEEVADYGLVGAAFILSVILVAFSTIVWWGVFLGREISRWANLRRGGDLTTVQPPVGSIEPGSVDATRPV